MVTLFSQFGADTPLICVLASIEVNLAGYICPPLDATSGTTDVEK